MQIPLEHGQRMFTPLEEGTILQRLELKGNETVLEIGTGCGFLTALLSKLAKKVYSVDYYADFTAHAAKKLKAHHCDNVELLTGDASRGWLEKAPYDVIVFSGAIEHLTETHRLQILPGGKLLAIEGCTSIQQVRLYELSHDELWTSTFLFDTDVPFLMDPLKPKEFVF